jgi:hypothetical protein
MITDGYENNYITESVLEAKNYVDEAELEAKSFVVGSGIKRIEVVSALPDNQEDGVLYVVK